MNLRGRPLILVATIVLAVATLATGACSRLTFVRQDFSREGYERTSPEVDVSGKPGNRNASEAMKHLQLAQVRLMSGDIDTAEREANKALKLDPASADAHTVLAAAAARRGAPAEAGRHYLRATELAPGNGALANNYGVWLCGQGQPAESLVWFERALADARYGTPALALANSGTCAMRAGQDVRAGRELRKAIGLDPNNAQALGALAELEFRKGNAFEARAFSERRLAAAPADRNALQLASQIEEKLGDTAAAARYVQRMRAEFPQTRGSGMGDDGTR
ncbi:type IV pilus biogenesis/stability protein PilW [Lysobacter sp. LF1]|uniref:Type IV pilus biogenesis/stability protein PilW n=1 Tax=Lysobacter stagni TaxID=3045172 RepID=A0ABT6XJ32_9GAMM|nr:type IV pilus biogenesis/stability protein PilW [Lysobacter sp. LF1]MDI9239780.1 type IV pilus biogenesis/stability protein PilW [Lysobacter sp. LF1]